MTNYILNEAECPYISYPVLEKFKWLRHGASTKLGGVSNGIHSTMNLGFFNGDRKENVFENYGRICKAIGVDPSNVVLSRQTHEDNIRVVTVGDIGKGYNKECDYSNIDALITNETGPVLVIITADCIPVYLVDPVNRAIGLAHSGWKGTVKKIASKTVMKMHREYGTNPEDVIAVTGSGICCSCYEVGEEVSEQFRSEFTEKQCLNFIDMTAEKPHIDLAKAIKESLLETGLKEENIVISGFCTACNSDILFSHRVTQGKRGTLAAFLSIV